MSPYDAQDVHSLAVENAKIMTRLDGIADAVGDLKEAVSELRADIRADRDQYVTRAEFREWAAPRDREIRELKDANERRHIPWTAVGAFFLGSVSLVITLIQVAT